MIRTLGVVSGLIVWGGLPNALALAGIALIAGERHALSCSTSGVVARRSRYRDAL